MGVGAQVTISGYHGLGNVDVPVFPDMMYKSNTADAVWWEPRYAVSYLIFANSSAETLQVKISDGDGRHSNLEIPPHGTVFRRAHDDEGAQAKSVHSLHVEANGIPGTLRVTGYTLSESEGFVNTIRSFDPAASSEPTIYGNGLHFSGGTNHLVVKNVSTQFIRVSGTIYPLSANSSPRFVLLPPKSIGPGMSEELDLSGIGKPETLDGAALRIDSSGPIASVIASFTNYSVENRIVRPTPFKDIGDFSVSTGAYPWRLDGQYRSRIYLTNVGKVRAAVGGRILPVGGPAYFIDSHYLDVGETALFDLRQIRDEQTPDPRGIKLAKNATIGQFQWSTIFGDGTQRFIGRNEVLDPTSGISASFSCGGCQCPLNTVSASVTPGNVQVFENSQYPGITVSADQTSSCTGAYVDSFTVDPTSWNVSAPSILSLTSGAPHSTLTGLKPGSSSYYTPFNGIAYAYNGQIQQCFIGGTPQINPGGSGNVCALPTTESNVAFSSQATISSFEVMISDAGGNSFDGRTVYETSPVPSGSNSCYWPGNPDNIPQHPIVNGRSWTVGGAPITHNHYGFDYIGYYATAVGDIRTLGVAAGVQMPCTATLTQIMSIDSCGGPLPYPYITNALSITVNASSVKNCRASVCATLNQ